MTRKFIAGAACAAAFVLAGCAAAGTGPAPSAIVGTPAERAAAPAGQLFVWYNGGPVLVKPKMYLIFWGYKRYGDPNHVQRLLELYAKNAGGSAHDEIYTQYYEKSGKSKIHVTNPKDQFGGVWSDDSAVPKTPTDSEVAAEAVKSIAHLGYDPNGLYFVATPHGRSSLGFGTHWCAYHSYTYYESAKLLPYVNMPYIPDTDGCGKNIIAPPSDESGADEGVTTMAGDEYAEGITDPQPFTGWKGVDGEIGDPCAWHNMANDRFGRKRYTTQPELSNATHSCVQTYK